MCIVEGSIDIIIIIIIQATKMHNIIVGIPVAGARSPNVCAG